VPGARPAERRAIPPVDPSAVPTLVINGDLGNITAWSGARVVASRFPNSTFVATHNAIHVSALGDRTTVAGRRVAAAAAAMLAP
jgi:hypothetical protein